MKKLFCNDEEFPRNIIIKKCYNNLENNLNYYFLNKFNLTYDEIKKEKCIKIIIRNSKNIKKIEKKLYIGCSNEKEYKSIKNKLLVSVLKNNENYIILKRGELKKYQTIFS